MAFGFWLPYVENPNPINAPLVEQQRSRASGFTMKGEAKYLKDAKSGKLSIYARMFATGPMHDDEVIRMEGVLSLITPDGHVQAIAPSASTFSDNLVATMNVTTAPKGSKVKISGTVWVYKRREVKTERELTKDRESRLYINTGTVTFRTVPNSKPAKVEVECLDLGSVHQHGLELLGADKKTVSNRFMLTPGKQLIDRENVPFIGRQLGMEPYLVRQLIPKRNEPVELVIPVADL